MLQSRSSDDKFLWSDGEVVIGELSPFSGKQPLHLFPVTFNLIPVH